MTTDKDGLHDRCIAAATELCLSMGLRYGIDQITEAMAQAGMAAATEIRDEHRERNARQADMLQGVCCD